MQGKNKILFDCERMKYPHTGLFHFCYHLGKSVAAMATPEMDMHFYVPRQQTGVFGKEQHYVTQHSLHKFFMQFASRYDVWHCTYQGSNFFPYRRNVKKVFTVHDLNFLHENKNFLKEKKYLRDLQLKVNEADAVVAISQYVKDEMQQHLNLKGKTIEVVYNGCNITPGVEPQKPVWLTDRPFIFSIGTIAAKKNFHVLPRMLAGNDHHLVIAGITQDKEYELKIVAEAKKLGVQDRLMMAGPVTEPEKYWLLQHCSLFAFPSLAEGFGLPVIEAMYFGRPVVLSKATSLPEIGGNAASYFTSFEDDAMATTALQAINNFTPGQATLLQQRAALFSWANAGAAYIDIYKRLANH